VGTRHTTTTVGFSPTSVDVNQSSTTTVTVTDDGASGTKSNPLGTVALSSSINGDTISGSPCTLVAVVNSTTQTSCQITVTPNSASIHTLTANYTANDSKHSNSSGNAGLTVNKRATTTIVSFSANPIVETDNTTATVTVTDTDSDGTKSNPGVGTTVGISSDSGDTITGTCTLAALSTDKSTCHVTVTATHASIHTITATFSTTSVHAGSDGGGQLTVIPHTLTIDNLNFTSVGLPLPTGFASPGIRVSHTLSDSIGIQHHDHVVTTAQNIAHGCKLAPSTPVSKTFDQSVVGLTNVAFKTWEIGKKPFSTAKKKKCSSVELKITSFSVFAVENPPVPPGLVSNTLSATVSFCFSTATGIATACPTALAPTKNAPTKGATVATATKLAAPSGADRLDPPEIREPDVSGGKPK
jgi:hypothetical protein